MKKRKDNREANLYSWKYYLLVVVIFLVGLSLMLYSESAHVENNWIHFVGEIGAFVAAAIASHFIYDKFLRKDEQLLFIENLRQLQFEKESGIVTTYEKFPLNDFLEEIKVGKKRLWILQTWIPNFISLEDSIRAALEKGVHVELLILDPKSSYANLRGAELGMEEDADHVSREINSTLSKLSQLSSELKHPANLQVKLFDSSSVFGIYAIDENIYLGFLWRKKNSIEAPHLKLKLKEDSYYFSHYAKRHFDLLWKSAQSVNFSEGNWKK
jgi:hypothetical protein